MNRPLPLRLISSGVALPAMQVSADMLDRQLGKRSGFVFARGGVRNRYFAGPDQSQSQLGALALRDACERGDVAPHSIDLLIGACGVQEQALPGTACAIAEFAQLRAGTPALDVNASCLSFVTALHMAASLLATASYRRIAIVSVDLPSRGIDWDDPEASLIFGDGAAAVIVETANRTEQAVRAYRHETYVEGRTLCEIRAGGTQRNPRNGVEPRDFLFRMQGKSVFRLASRYMPEFLQRLTEALDGGLRSVDLVVPHQASHLGMAHLRRRLGIDADRIVDIYAERGNQVAASMPSALHQALIDGRARSGRRVMLVGTAAGLALGGLVLDL